MVRLKPTVIPTMELRISEPTSWIRHWFLLLCHNVNIFGINNALIDLHPVVPKESASVFPAPLRSVHCLKYPSYPAERKRLMVSDLFSTLCSPAEAQQGPPVSLTPMQRVRERSARGSQLKPRHTLSEHENPPEPILYSTHLSAVVPAQDFPAGLLYRHFYW